ncbi:hypothetical protein FE257_005572 [Aspergillus nanangensis]|uniref:Thioesterase domain-containing protein n=1 Tax=Aspergillus nanangensis TaxID=2582783 RepID=A0AAD4CQD3_ASPNN|nr:hypothetical protein FE257_005572 [Aspergillus nanangensis]
MHQAASRVSSLNDDGKFTSQRTDGPGKGHDHRPGPLLQCLLEGYQPTIRPHRLGRELEAVLQLSRRQQMCYYEGKLFGGYLTFLLDQILADCCKPAVTAYLHTDFARPIAPHETIHLRAWPEKIEGRKVFLRGAIQVSADHGHGMVDAVQARALFIRSKSHNATHA